MPKQSPIYRILPVKAGLPRRQRARAAARKDICKVENLLLKCTR